MSGISLAAMGRGLGTRSRSMDAKKTSPHQPVNRILLDYTFLSLMEQHPIHSPALTEKNEQTRQRAHIPSQISFYDFFATITNFEGLSCAYPYVLFLPYFITRKIARLFNVPHFLRLLHMCDLWHTLPRAHPKRDVDYPPYYEAMPKIVTTWSEYIQIVLESFGAIIVNTSPCRRITR